ncbi:MAG: hypothetical protein ABI220_04240 [Candidatus Saccharimonadales bacterium]
MKQFSFHTSVKLLKDSAGTTLIELLVVMGLLGGMLVIITTLFTSSVDSQVQSKSYSAPTESSHFIVARLNYDIARASAISTPVNMGDIADQLVMTIDGNTYTYSLDNGNLTLDDGNGPANLNSNDVTVSDVSFRKLGVAGSPATISYSFKLTSKIQSHAGLVSRTYTSTVRQNL